VGPPGYGESPYSAESAFAGSPWLVSLDGLVEMGLLDADASAPREALASARVEPATMLDHRTRCLHVAFETFEARRAARPAPAFQDFCGENASWLEDFSLFRALKRENGGVAWTRWEPGIRDREPGALRGARERHAHAIAFERFVQYAFDVQWRTLRARARQRGVGLIGDLPIFVAHDSADVWTHREDFFLDAAGEPTLVAGCPPDYFSATGQRWGNPLYRWRRMKKTGYAWWIARLRAALKRFDVVRLDHFIGFERYWEIPATEPTAVAGRWMKGPGIAFFDAARSSLGDLPLIAEDLGETTPAVYALRDRLGLPGIKILQFAFGDDASAPTFLPHNYPRRAVVYTGTHDNDTAVGWFHGLVEGARGDSTRTPAQLQREREAAALYLGTRDAEIHWAMMRVASASVARLCIFPLQDVLGLGSEARMNRPGVAGGNWTWRFEQGALSPQLAARLAQLTRTYGRATGEGGPR
jgi:4-alpha-glucanotransferase